MDFEDFEVIYKKQMKAKENLKAWRKILEKKSITRETNRKPRIFRDDTDFFWEEGN